jgi:hypothetical protein
VMSARSTAPFASATRRWRLPAGLAITITTGASGKASRGNGARSSTRGCRSSTAVCSRPLTRRTRAASPAS